MDKFETTEISVVVVANSNNPTILNPDFLRINYIVPENWELAKPPICVEPMAEVAYKNNVRITAQLDRVMFHENFMTGQVNTSNIKKLSSQYIKTIPHVNYKAVGINFAGHIGIKNLYNFSPESVIKQGDWLKFGDRDVQTALTFKYSIDSSMCSLSIDRNLIKQNDQEIPIIIFRANFHRNIETDNQKEKLEIINNYLDKVDGDYSIFLALVENIFLGKEAQNAQ
ncbi:MAG: hypothetical protein KJ737_22945 [Proteobacteria bacterium]|nr:hypothetical protein [Pseudomonadota bacterium]